MLNKKEKELIEMIFVSHDCYEDLYGGVGQERDYTIVACMFFHENQQKIMFLEKEKKIVFV